MTGISTNAKLVAKLFMQRRLMLQPALERGMKRFTAKVENEATDNLSGGGDASPGSYPVPVRTGTSRRGMNLRARGMVGYVWNKIIYAAAIHEDRPFLDDAADSVDGLAIMREELERIW